jgi:AbrB family looped-hinge helix DNA binding protein
MRTTIDRAGRVVIPKTLRDALGLEAGEVDLIRDGAGVRIEPVTGDGTIVEGERLVIPDETPFNDGAVQSLRFADQR